MPLLKRYFIEEYIMPNNTRFTMHYIMELDTETKTLKLTGTAKEEAVNRTYKETTKPLDPRVFLFHQNELIDAVRKRVKKFDYSDKMRMLGGEFIGTQIRLPDKKMNAMNRFLK